MAGVSIAALGSSVVLECGTRSLQDMMERQDWCTSLGFTDVSLLFGLSILACTSLCPTMVRLICGPTAFMFSVFISADNFFLMAYMPKLCEGHYSKSIRKIICVRVVAK